ncbi:MAG: hypothetical protein ABJB86_24660, partial [Bacteroidota bacterium]
LLLKGDGKGNFVAVNEKQSGILVKGQVRDIKEIKSGKKTLTIFAMNNEAPKFYQGTYEPDKKIAPKRLP